MKTIENMRAYTFILAKNTKEYSDWLRDDMDYATEQSHSLSNLGGFHDCREYTQDYYKRMGFNEFGEPVVN